MIFQPASWLGCFSALFPQISLAQRVRVDLKLFRGSDAPAVRQRRVLRRLRFAR